MIEYLKDVFLSRLKPKKAIFIHIQKTAGTSIVHLAAENYGNENIISHGDYVNYQPSDLIYTPFISGHFGYEYAQPLMAGRKSFTFLRNPAERILSLYYFYRSQPADTFPMYQIAHDNSLEAFLKLGLDDSLVKSRIWNNQTWQLAYGYGGTNSNNLNNISEAVLLKNAITNINQLDYVGCMETFDKDIKKISKILKWSTNYAVKENKNSKRSAYEALSSKEEFLLSDLIALDSELYNYLIHKQ